MSHTLVLVITSAAPTVWELLLSELLSHEVMLHFRGKMNCAACRQQVRDREAYIKRRNQLRCVWCSVYKPHYLFP